MLKRCYFEITIPAGALARQGAAASESIYPVNTTGELWQEPARKLKLRSCVNPRIWTCIVCRVCVVFGDFLLLFDRQENSFHTVSVLNCHFSPPQTSRSYFFQKTQFLSPKRRNFPQPPLLAPGPRAASAPAETGWARFPTPAQRTARCPEHKALPTAWALGSSEDTDRGRGLWNHPLQLLINFNKPPYFPLI